MSFEAHEQRLKQIFSGDSSFLIPRNQRNYVWEERNWRELADDIKYVFDLLPNRKDISHFIGSFVFQQEDDQYTIIDGQQRITTLMLMLSAICVLQNELQDEDEFGITKQYLIGNIGLKSQYQRLTNNDISNLKLIVGLATEYNNEIKQKSIFSDIPLNKTQKADKQVVSGFWFFYNYFQELSDSMPENLVKIRSIIVDMKVIHIISENELDCYEVFEILNARGVSLQDNELIKNYIFKYVQPKTTVDTAKAKWDHILNNMSKCNDNIEQFLNNYFTSRFPKSSGKISTFQLVKEKIPKKEIENLLDELVECSNIYIYFYHPEKHENAIVRDVLQFFKLENQRQFRPIFLSYFLAFSKNLISEKEFEKAFILIRNFYFSFGLICKNLSNVLESCVYTVANQVYNSTEVVGANDFYNAFKKYYPSEETFKNFFIEKGFSNKNRLYKNSKGRKEAKYILEEIERYYQKQQGGELICDVTQCNVEHINSDSEFDDTPCKIGNLLLISSSINSNVGNITFVEKLEEYKKSNLMNVKKFTEHYGEIKEWNEQMILKRGEMMAKLAYNHIWNFKV